MNNYQEIMKEHYLRELVGTIFVAVLFIAALVFVFIAIKKWELPKWILLFCLIILPINIYSAVHVKRIADDIKNSSYVIYEGEDSQICKGMEERQSTVICVDGKEKTLVSLYEMTENGTFDGYVVYSERSGYVVYVGENFPD